MTAKRTTPAVGFGSIHRDEVLPLREAARRMGWGPRTVRLVQRQGLKVATVGRMKYLRGCDLLDWFATLTDGGPTDA